MARPIIRSLQGECFDSLEHLLTEYQYEWAGAPNPMVVITTEPHARLDAINEGAGSLPAVIPFDKELAEAQANGNYQKTLAMKNQQIEDWLR